MYDLMERSLSLGSAVGLGRGLLFRTRALFAIDSGVIFGRILRPVCLASKGSSPGDGGCIADTTMSLLPRFGDSIRDGDLLIPDSPGEAACLNAYL